MSQPPKEPHRMATVNEQIRAHPRYLETSEGFRFAFEVAHMGGYSWTTAKNNKWARAVWRRLYLDTPMPKNEDDIFPAAE